MSYYRFNRQEISQKAKERYSKEKAAEYYSKNKEAIKEMLRERYKNLSQEKKTRLKSTKEKSIKNWFSIKKKCYKVAILELFYQNILHDISHVPEQTLEHVKTKLRNTCEKYCQTKIPFKYKEFIKKDIK